MNFPVKCDDSTLTTSHSVHKWSANMVEGMHRIGQDIDVTGTYKDLMVRIILLHYMPRANAVPLLTCYSPT